MTKSYHDMVLKMWTTPEQLLKSFSTLDDKHITLCSVFIFLVAEVNSPEFDGKFYSASLEKTLNTCKYIDVSLKEEHMEALPGFF